MAEYITGIYKITNRLNNKCYIGSAKNINIRIQQHKTMLLNNKHHCKHLQKAYNLDGQEVFEFITLLYCSIKDLLFYEQRFLNVYWDNSKNCYNMCKIAGSTLGRRLSDETKLKLSISHKGKVLSEKTKARISIASSLRKHSEETKKKMSEIKKNQSEETKKKIGLAHKGKKASPETIEKLKISHQGQISTRKGIAISKEHYAKCKETMFKLGNSPWNTGKEHSINTKEKIRLANSKLTIIEILQIRDLLKSKLFSQKEVGIFYNVKAGTISDIHTGKNWKDIK